MNTRKLLLAVLAVLVAAHTSVPLVVAVVTAVPLEPFHGPAGCAGFPGCTLARFGLTFLLVRSRVAPIGATLAFTCSFMLALGLVALGWLLAASRPGAVPAWAGRAGRR